MKNCNELFEKIESLLTENTPSHKVVICAFGMLNAGKSSLLNTLSGNWDTDYFKVADQRETAILQEFENEHYIYLDTPGLDATDDDTKTALAGGNSADILLFVHAADRGELEAKELQFLKEQYRTFGEYVNEHIVIVLNKSDSKNDNEINKIKTRIKEQCKETLDFEPQFVCVSCTRYKKGMATDSPVLIEKSNISTLSEQISNLADSCKAVREARKQQHIDLLLEELNEAEREVKQIVLEKQNQLNDMFSDFTQQVKQLTTKATALSRQYKKI